MLFLLEVVENATAFSNVSLIQTLVSQNLFLTKIISRSETSVQVLEDLTHISED